MFVESRYVLVRHHPELISIRWPWRLRGLTAQDDKSDVGSMNDTTWRLSREVCMGGGLVLV